MRTTIEISDTQRAKLLKLAAERGAKGFSSLVQEAIDLYLEAETHRWERVEKALAVLGTLDESAADALEASAQALRARWR